jgi:hypothetical protein
MYQDESGRLGNVPSVMMLKQAIRKAMDGPQTFREDGE